MKRLGIIGDGQLSRYMVKSCKELGIPVTVLGRAESPAGLLEVPTVSSFSELLLESDVLSFENEFFESDLLRSEMESLKKKIDIFPRPENVELLRQKHLQKVLLESLQIPTAKYVAFEGRDVDDFLRTQNRIFPEGCVLKWSTGGYDSKGLHFCGPGSRLGETRDFCLQARNEGRHLYSEEWVDFDKEVAILGARSQNGQIRIFPLVQTVQDVGICRKVIGPVLEEAWVSAANDIVTTLLEELEYVGVLAVEMFVTKKGDLIVNELAPRVHNSGHYSLLATHPSQFEMHVRCVMGMELPELVTPKHFAMWNILGPKDIIEVELNSPIKDNDEISEGIEVFWYQKDRVKVRRKMGHLCASASTAEELGDKVGRMMAWEEKFWQTFQHRS